MLLNSSLFNCSNCKYEIGKCPEEIYAICTNNHL